MGRFGSFLFGILVGGGAVYGAMTYHVIYARDGIHLVPKLHAGLGDTYVDVRSFDLGDWQSHKSLAAALIQADKAYLLEDAAKNQLRDSVEDLLEGALPSSP